VPNWNAGELEEELKSHGLRYLDEQPTRAANFIQQGLEEVVGMWEWPFREVVESATHSSVINGLGKVVQVVTDDGDVLVPAKRADLMDRYSKAPNPGGGTPIWYYPFGDNQLFLYPEPTDPSETPFAVTHYSTLPWLSSVDGSRIRTKNTDSAVPVVPPEYRDTILLAALVRAKRDANSPEQVDQYHSDLERRIENMREQLLVRQTDEPNFIRRTGEWA